MPDHTVFIVIKVATEMLFVKQGSPSQMPNAHISFAAPAKHCLCLSFSFAVSASLAIYVGEAR